MCAGGGAGRERERRAGESGGRGIGLGRGGISRLGRGVGRPIRALGPAGSWLGRGPVGGGGVLLFPFFLLCFLLVSYYFSFSKLPKWHLNRILQIMPLPQ